MDCPICDEKSSSVSLSVPDSAFKYASNILKFQPTSKVNVQKVQDMSGGLVISVKNQNELQRRMRPLLDLIPKKLNVLHEELSKQKSTKDSGIVMKYCNPMLKSFKEVGEEVKNTKPSYTDLLQLFKTSRDQAADCSSQLKYLKERNLGNHLSVITKRLFHYIESFYQLNVEVGIEPIKSLEQGKILSYTGKFCLHALCSENMDVKVFDVIDDVLTDPKCAKCSHVLKSYLRQGRVTIKAVSIDEMKMSSRITLLPGNSITLWVERNTQQVEGKNEPSRAEPYKKISASLFLTFDFFTFLTFVNFMT